MSTEFFSKKVFSVEDAERQLEEMMKRNDRIPGFRERYGYPNQQSFDQTGTKIESSMKRK